jgi:RNA polymerase sigma-70 factor (ECF subfamily)
MNKKTLKMAENEDGTLVRRCLKGDKKAFEMLIRKYQQPLMNYLGRMTQERELSLDFSQEVFLRAYSALHTYREKYHFSTWLFRIASNLLIDHWRKKKLPLVFIDSTENEDKTQPVQLPDREPSIPERYERQELVAAIEKALCELPQYLSELFILRHINDFSYEEIAAIKNLPVGTVKNRIFQTKEMLRTRLGEK